jgi:hypothetical protein
MTISEYRQAIQDYDPHHPQTTLSREERQQAMDAFVASVRETDNATQAEIEVGIDQMLERIYSARTLAEAPLAEKDASAGA